MTRQMALVGFLQAQNCTNLPSSWRHPESRDDSMSASGEIPVRKVDGTLLAEVGGGGLRAAPSRTY